MSMLNARFKRGIFGVSAGTVQTSQAGAGTSNVSGSLVNIKAKPGPPLTYRINLAGTKTGANAAAVIHLKLGATQVCSLTQDAGAAVDWAATFIIAFKDSKNQRIIGTLAEDTGDMEINYAAGTVDCSAGVAMVCQIESGNASDTVTCEMVIIEGGE